MFKALWVNFLIGVKIEVFVLDIWSGVLKSNIIRKVMNTNEYVFKEAYPLAFKGWKKEILIMPGNQSLIV